MAYKVINEDEPVPMDRALIAVIYGDPGVYKTSLAFTSENPMLLDFDKGVLRCVGRKKTVNFDNWDDVNGFMESDEIKKNGIKSLIIDTGGVMLDDYLSNHIIRMDTKYGNGAGGLGLKGYGIQKSTFQTFLSRCMQLGVESVIFICHTEESGDSDNAKHSPKLTGGSYSILMSKADLVGFMEIKNNKSHLNFSPTSKHYGKNSAEFPPFDLPHYTKPEWNGFMADILAKTRTRFTQMSEAQVAAIKLVNQFSDHIGECESTDQLETIMPEIEKLSAAYKIQVMNLYDVRYADIFKEAYFRNVETPDDFDTLALAMKELPTGVRNLLIPALKELQTAKGVVYDKKEERYKIKPSEPVPPATTIAAQAASTPADEKVDTKVNPPKEEKPKETKKTEKKEVAAQTASIRRVDGHP